VSSSIPPGIQNQTDTPQDEHEDIHIRTIEKAKKEKASWYEYVFLGGAAEDQVHIGKSRTGP
jgi:hypothetical protein